MVSPVMILQLTRLSDDRVHVLTIKCPKGQPEAEVKLPFDGLQRKAVTLALEAQLFKASDWNTSEGAQRLATLQKLGLADNNGFAEKMQQRIGQTLFGAFFPPGPLLEALHATLDSAPDANAPARIELRLNANATDLGLYPWELLYDAESRCFLFSGRASGIVRYIAHTKPVPGLLTAQRLRVLFVAARPVDPSQVQQLPDQEDTVIRQGLAVVKDKKSIRLDVLPAASSVASTYELLGEALSSAAKAQTLHILHFDGHGGFGIRCERCGSLNRSERASCFRPGCGDPLGKVAQGYLAFERINKTVDWVSAEEFANLLKGAGIRLVVLSACKSAVAAGESVFSGVAPALIGAGVPAVVAMQYSISAAASGRFAQVFYRSLGQRSSLIAAMGEVRTALFGEFQESWYRPVLYLRVDEVNPEGHLFAAAKETTEPPRRMGKKTALQEVSGGVVFMGNATIGGRAQVSARDIITNRTLTAVQLQLPTAGRYEPTGDYQIDQVQQTLGTLGHLNTLGQRRGAGDVPLEELFPQLSQLFQRGAFEDHVCKQNEQSMKLLLYAVTATELTLRPWRQAILQHGRKGDLKAYDALRREVKLMRDKLANAYGSTFSLTAHIDEHGLHKDSFVAALPDCVYIASCEEAEPHRVKAVELAHQLFDRG